MAVDEEMPLLPIGLFCNHPGNDSADLRFVEKIPFWEGSFDFIVRQVLTEFVDPHLEAGRLGTARFAFATTKSQKSL